MWKRTLRFPYRRFHRDSSTSPIFLYSLNDDDDDDDDDVKLYIEASEQKTEEENEEII